MSDICFDTHHTATRSFWQGTQPLWKAFWLLYIGGHVICGVVFVLTGWMESQADWWPEGPLKSQMQVVMAIGIQWLLLAYFVLCFIAVWRSSARHPRVVLRWSARVLLVVHALWWLMELAVWIRYFDVFAYLFLWLRTL